MSDRVRLQLQQGHTTIDSVTPKSISADDALAGLSELYKKKKDFANDPKWESGFAAAINDARNWIKRVKQGGGYVPSPTKQTQHQSNFTYKGKDYRIDIETFGSKDADWLR